MILDEIVAHKKIEILYLPPVDHAALRALPPCRGFRAALRRPEKERMRVIAECKKGSPSKGVFAKNYDPVKTAFQYVHGGASCLSVLTDEQFFFGHLDHLRVVREVVHIPIIRKDFVIDERQIAEARLAGADAILLIVACLEDGRMRDLHGFARECGLDVLVEVHDAQEAVRALALKADLIGVNNRNLQDFSVSLETTYSLLPALVDTKRVIVSESGIFTRDDCRRLEEARVDAVLVGEALMTSPDPSEALKRLRGQISQSIL